MDLVFFSMAVVFTVRDKLALSYQSVQDAYMLFILVYYMNSVVVLVFLCTPSSTHLSLKAKTKPDVSNY